MALKLIAIYACLRCKAPHRLQLQFHLATIARTESSMSKKIKVYITEGENTELDTNQCCPEPQPFSLNLTVNPQSSISCKHTGKGNCACPLIKIC